MTASVGLSEKRTAFFDSAKNYLDQKTAQLDWRKLWPKRSRVAPLAASASDANEPVTQADRALVVSSIGLGLATLGVLGQPLLGLASLPVAVYLCRGRFQVAYRVLRDERRITPPVLDATRVVVCVAMGYSFIAALDAWLQTVTQKVLVQSEVDFQRRLEEQFGKLPETVYVFTKGTEVAIAPDAMNLGDVIAIESGEAAPTNGLILYGSAWVNEALATGATQPIFKQVGDQLHAATVVLGERLYVQTEANNSKNPALHIQEALPRTVESKSYMQQVGEASGQRAAPYLMALFAVTIPFWGVNRAAAFLTASLGSQMRTLGPFTLRNFVNQAAQQGILIKDGRVLERACLLNTIIIDAEVLTDPALHDQARTTIAQLRGRRWPAVEITRQPFAVYVLGVGTDSAQEAQMSQLAQTIGADDCLLAASPAARAEVLEGLQSNGRFIGYIGAANTEPNVMKQAAVAMTVGGAAGMDADAVQLVLTAQTLAQLDQFFDLATDFVGKQIFNISWPLFMDVVDISTTVFVHLGLVYSIFFTYAGTLTGLMNARTSLHRHEAKVEQEQVAKALSASASHQ
ncbi:MAG: hypothetical protein U0350_38890 [Caldilineaceae bacterium]